MRPGPVASRCPGCWAGGDPALNPAGVAVPRGAGRAARRPRTKWAPGPPPPRLAGRGLSLRTSRTPRLGPRAAVSGPGPAGAALGGAGGAGAAEALAVGAAGCLEAPGNCLSELFPVARCNADRQCLCSQPPPPGQITPLHTLAIFLLLKEKVE